MSQGRVILSQERFALTVERLSHQLIEAYDRFEDTCLVGIQPRGVILAERIRERLCAILSLDTIPLGKLDITFYRDDFRKRDKPLKASTTDMEFLVENQNVVLVDDVLYTGRSVNAALTALNHYGRPKHVDLLVLVDRRFNRHLPIQPDFTGIAIDALDNAYVRVDWGENKEKNSVLLFANKEESLETEKNT